ncbi:hypothetical protein AX16_000541 [Volvariella volvacea WC 439]|nr:hypothetical protein AX16_000541 [Volvariella volvacea WC 439]
MLFVLKKVTGVLATVVTDGVIKSAHTDFVLDLLAKVSGLPLPKEGNAILETKLNEVLKRMDTLVEGQQELKEHITKTHKLVAIRQASSKIIDIWRELVLAIKIGDSTRIFNNIQRIEDKNVNKGLEEIYQSLAEADVFEESLGSLLKKTCLDALCHHKRHLNYDVTQYHSQVTRWRNALIDIDILGTSLLVLYEQCRKTDKQIVLDYQRTRIERGKDRRKKYDEIFLGGFAKSPAFKTLLNIAYTNPKEQFPKIWEMPTEKGGYMYIFDRYVVPVSMGPGPARGYYIYTFSEDMHGHSHPINKAFALERLTDGTWAIYGTRALQYPEDPLPFARWTRLKNGNDDPIIREWEASDACFKIIPIPHETDNDVYLLWLTPNKDDVKKIWRVSLSPFPRSYPTFGEPTEQAISNFRTFIHTHEGQKFHCGVWNRTSYVFVLDDAYANGTYHYTNTIWTPGEKICVGAWGMGVRSCFRFALFRVKDAPSDVEALRARVQELWGPVPGTGRLGLKYPGAELVSYLWVRVKVPVIGKNSIGAVEVAADYEYRNIVDLKDPIQLSNELDKYMAYEKETRCFEWNKIKAEVHVQQGHTPWAYITVDKK